MAAEPPELTISTTHAGDTTTVVLEGEIDLATSTQLNRELDAMLDRVPPPVRLRVDLAAVNFMDTTGVAVLLKARRRAQESGCRFAVSSTSPAIARLFDITGLAGLLTDGNGE
jgi:anti-sigma B factor antagonist